MKKWYIDSSRRDQWLSNNVACDLGKRIPAGSHIKHSDESIYLRLAPSTLSQYLVLTKSIMQKITMRVSEDLEKQLIIKDIQKDTEFDRRYFRTEWIAVYRLNMSYTVLKPVIQDVTKCWSAFD